MSRPVAPGSANEDEASAQSPLLVLEDARFLEHKPSTYHPERPERLHAAARAVAALAYEKRPVAARFATEEMLTRVHGARFVESVLALRGASKQLDPDTYVSPGSVDAALLAAGGVVALVDELLDGHARQGVACVRPPGHHARPDQAMGFCLFNNVAVAAAHARARGLSRVAIVDWDVHHGNGTQEAFYGDPSVLYVSTHQYPFYPGTGALEETGKGEGFGYTINVPLTAGGGDDVYEGAFDRVLLPALEAYRPELILVSAGFDAATRDPLAQMTLSDQAFGFMAATLSRLADTTSQGRIALVLEGGYDLHALEGGLGAALEGMVRQKVVRSPAPSLTGRERSSSALLRGVDHDDVVRAAKVTHRAWKDVR